MDITFHYFAIKTLARRAGFDEAEAQRIATYSEYIDEFDWITYLDCKNIPDYIKNSEDHDLYLPSVMTLNTNFNPAMTGFIGIIDMAFLTLERTQKFTVSPFHFIPPSIAEIAKDVRTVPALVGDGSLISNVVIDARNALLSGEEPRQISLMRLGMVLHTFADTYAHQLFSGYDSWVNDVKVVSVTDNITNADLTLQVNAAIGRDMEQAERYRAESNTSILPCIGHMWAGHTPDLTNVSFEMSYKGSDRRGYDRTHVRSNTETFVTASRHILNFLLSCRGQDALPERDWAPFAERLAEAFLFHFPERDTATVLAAHWHEVFPEYDYAYSKDAVEGSFYLVNAAEGEAAESPLGTNYTEEFYRYNFLADDLLVRMYGPNCRRSWWN